MHSIYSYLLTLLLISWLAIAMTTDEAAPPPSPTAQSETYAPMPQIPPSSDPPMPKHPTRPPYSTFALKCAALPNSTVNAACGAAAGIASGIVTCPLDVIKTRLQAQGSWRPRDLARPSRVVYSGLVNTARVIWVEDGIKGMYRGLGPMLLGYVPTWAVYMTVYDSSKDFYYTQIGVYWGLLRPIAG
jgi:solute carrier family 25 folate transporter 32